MTELKTSKDPEVDDPARSVASERSGLWHVVGGALMGAGYGTLFLAEFNKEQKGASGLLFAAGFIVGGALVGFELYRTRTWGRFGKAGRVARWLFAFGSASAAAATLLLLRGTSDRSEFWLATVFGSALGLGFWANEERDLWEAQASAADRAREWRLRLWGLGVVILVLIGTCFIKS